jgi:hypothetical protein
MNRTSPLWLNQVFAATELLESILAQLPPRDLLLAQRVCRRWRDTIVGSIALQQRLFFCPITDGTVKPYFNSLLQAIFPPWFSLELSHQNIQQQAWFLDTSRRTTVLNPVASWRRTFPVQPPAKIDRLSSFMHCRQLYGEQRNATLRAEFEEQQKDGARMSLIYDMIVGWLDSDASATCRVVWHMFSSEHGHGLQPRFNYPRSIPLRKVAEE